jgi:nucleoside-diphosphate-sugar epimerase
VTPSDFTEAIMTITRILVTGGFGALGHNLIQRLQTRGDCELHVVDNLSAGVANYSAGIRFTYLDIGMSETVGSFFRSYKPHVIFHLAAHFANQNSVDHPISDATTNVLGTINLFETQKENRDLRKVVYASSSCVYGDHEVMSEATPVGPYETPYAINKYVGELYCRYYANVHHVPTACARIFNSYGPGEMPGRYRNVIPNFIAKALKGEDIVITGTGEETRDFTFFSDTVDLLLKLAESEYRHAEVFNGGTGTMTSVRQMAESIIRLTGSHSKIVYVPARPWDHVKHRCADISKSKDFLKYAPSVEFERGLEETVKWVRSRVG